MSGLLDSASSELDSAGEEDALDGVARIGNMGLPSKELAKKEEGMLKHPDAMSAVLNQVQALVFGSENASGKPGSRKLGTQEGDTSPRRNRLGVRGRRTGIREKVVQQ